MAKNNQKTPLLQLLKNNGGTLYVFPSASEDIGLNLNYNANTVGLSHYALLNIPISKTVVDTEQDENAWLQNRFNPTIIPGHFEYVSKSSTISSVNDKPSWHIAASLQNYAMNFETLLVNQDTYNYKDYHTVSEKVFWKWLKETGAIRWKNSSTSNYYEEGDDDTNLYNRVVQCFGAIDSGNSLSSGFGMFNEIYVNIPTSYGSGKVFFTSSEDKNYQLNRKYIVSNSDKLEGRTEDDENNAVIYTTNQPFTDTDSSTNEYYDTTCDATNLYKDKTINYNSDTKPDGLSSEGEIIKNRISTLDGIEIVKDLSVINKLFTDEGITSTYDINSFDTINTNRSYTTLSEDEYTFDFNAILLYYSVYDNNNNTSDTALATNLFGILFLDKPTEVAGTTQNTGALTDFYIPTITKKQSSGEGGFGTGYSFRINIKTQSVYDNQNSVINDNTTQTSVIAEDFNDVLYALNQAINNMNTNVETTKAIQEKYTQILGYYGKQSVDISDLDKKLTAYINGERGDILTTNRMNASVYTSPDNTIQFGFNNGNTNTNGDVVYDVVSTLESDGTLNTSVVDVNRSLTKEGFVYTPDYSDAFDSIVAYSANNADNILDVIFNANNTVIKDSQKRYDGFTNKSGQNPTGGYYIDPNSSVFNKLQGSVLDENGNQYSSNDTHNTYKDEVHSEMLYTKTYINYVKFIPYLIAELIRQRIIIDQLTTTINSISNATTTTTYTTTASPSSPSSSTTTTTKTTTAIDSPEKPTDVESQNLSVALKIDDLNNIQDVSAYSYTTNEGEMEVGTVNIETDTTTKMINITLDKKHNNLVTTLKPKKDVIISDKKN